MAAATAVLFSTLRLTAVVSGRHPHWHVLIAIRGPLGFYRKKTWRFPAHSHPSASSGGSRTPRSVKRRWSRWRGDVVGLKDMAEILWRHCRLQTVMLRIHLGTGDAARTAWLFAMLEAGVSPLCAALVNRGVPRVRWTVLPVWDETTVGCFLAIDGAVRCWALLWALFRARRAEQAVDRGVPSASSERAATAAGSSGS